MKAKPKKPERAKGKRAKRAPAAGRWRLDELPADLQVELRDRAAQAGRGEDLRDFDEALDTLT